MSLFLFCITEENQFGVALILAPAGTDVDNGSYSGGEEGWKITNIIISVFLSL